MYIYIKKIIKKIIKNGFIGRFELKMSLLNFNFVMIYIIHELYKS